MKRLLCLVGLHDWLLKSEFVMSPNCHRVCRRCVREEVAVGYNTKVIWAEYISEPLVGETENAR